MRVEVYTANSLMGELVCITCIINWINKHWLLPRRNQSTLVLNTVGMCQGSCWAFREWPFGI